MAFEPFKAASTTAKIVNLLVLVFVFLSWVSTMVTFGSTLHTISGNDNTGTHQSLKFYWNQLHNFCIGGVCQSFSYDDAILGLSLQKSVTSCKSGGDATLAFAIFAFLAFLIHIPLLFCRFAGLNFPLARDVQHSLYIELVLTGIEWFCFFLQTCIWGGTCYSGSNSLLSSSSISGQGYGLIIACFFFLTFNLVVYFLMRSNDNLVLGNGSSRSSDSAYSGGGSDSGGEYSSDSSGQPTFSYQANPSDSRSTSL